MSIFAESIKKSMQTSLPFDTARREFNDFALDVVEKTLKIKERARELGERGLPTEGDSEKDEMARSIDFYFSQMITKANNQLSNILNAGKAQTNVKLQIEDDLVSVQMEANECESWLQKTARMKLEKIFNYKRNLHWMEREFDIFRKKNNRVGPAKYPDRDAKLRLWGVVFLLFSLELFLNSWVLGDAYPTGFTGVMVEVLLFSGVNLFLAWVLGHFIICEMGHMSAIRKWVAGIILSAVVIFVVVVINLFFAHYRDAIASLPTVGFDSANWQQLGGIAMSSLLEHPFEMQDFKSYLLWFAGMALVFWSSYKIFQMDDSYPGYGVLQRHQEKVSADYTKLCDDFLHEINSKVDRFNDHYRDKAGLTKAKRRAAQEWVERHNSIIGKYKNWLVLLKTAGAALYSRYRTENLMARTDGVIELNVFKSDFTLPDISETILDQFGTIEAEEYDDSEIERFYTAQSEEFKKQLKAYHASLKNIQELGVEDDDMDHLDRRLSAGDVVSSMMKEADKGE